MSRLAIITFLDPKGGDIDNTLPDGSPGHPSTGPIYPSGPTDPGYGHGRPGGGHPGNALPPPGSIATLPVFPFDPTRPDGGLPGMPDNTLPGGSGGSPDNTLPSRPPHPGIVPGGKFIVKWLACQGLILVPDNELPTTPPPTAGTLPGTTPEPK